MATYALQGVFKDGSVGSTVQTKQPIALNQGEALTINLTILNTDGSPKDLTGHTSRLRAERVDGSSLVDRAGATQVAADGTVQYLVTSAETKEWAPQVGAFGIFITKTATQASDSVLPRSDLTIIDAAIDLDAIPTSPPDAVSEVQTEDYDATINETVRCDPSGGAFTVTLPTAVGQAGNHITVKNVTDSTTAITVDCTDAEEIDGEVSEEIADAYGSLTFMSDGEDWMVVAVV